jgi:hypothetical protein
MLMKTLSSFLLLSAIAANAQKVADCPAGYIGVGTWVDDLDPAIMYVSPHHHILNIKQPTQSYLLHSHKHSPLILPVPLSHSISLELNMDQTTTAASSMFMEVMSIAL